MLTSVCEKLLEAEVGDEERWEQPLMPKDLLRASLKSESLWET